MRPGCLKETHFIKQENVQDRRSPEKGNLSYKTTSVQTPYKHDYQRHTWVLLGIFSHFFLFSPGKEIFRSEIYTRFHSPKKEKPQRFPSLDVKTYLIKRHFRSIAARYALTINKLPYQTRIIFLERKVSRVCSQRPAYSG